MYAGHGNNGGQPFPTPPYTHPPQPQQPFPPGTYQMQPQYNQFYPPSPAAQYPPSNVPYSRPRRHGDILGCGSFGSIVVYTDTRTQMHRQFAQKTIHNVFQTLNSCRRVYREIKMLGELKHENLLGLYDLLRPTDNKFDKIEILTELMETDLNRILLGTQQKLEPLHFKVFMYQILRGLKFLHSGGIIHRDIKPHNILVNADCLAKIGDFGFARMNSQEQMSHEVVTQFYRAPEILMGAKHYNEAIDIWAAGCIFAEMMSRTVLFEAESVMKQIEKIVELLGTPKPSEIELADPAVKNNVTMMPPKVRQDLFFMQMCLHSHMNVDQEARNAIVFLYELLKVDVRQRATATLALMSPYLVDGREMFFRDIRPNLNLPNMSYEPEPALDRQRVWSSFSQRDVDHMSLLDLREELFQYMRNYPLPPNISQPIFVQTSEAASGDFSKCVI
ncbi:hypothetical protein L596_018304 [Steinernema carpocapsae]|uniref:Protein kinase domain-containing protein n=1 Tax=Steinernema carpocapsae TaxID=34508 RepID=A0A4U5N495_STECR|nr:hypothetical protein L596_018304 [Steinernema carpocapsae]